MVLLAGTRICSWDHLTLWDVPETKGRLYSGLLKLPTKVTTWRHCEQVRQNVNLEQMKLKEKKNGRNKSRHQHWMLSYFILTITLRDICFTEDIKVQRSCYLSKFTKLVVEPSSRQSWMDLKSKLLLLCAVTSWKLSGGPDNFLLSQFTFGWIWTSLLNKITRSTFFSSYHLWHLSGIWPRMQTPSWPSANSLAYFSDHFFSLCFIDILFHSPPLNC